MSAIMLADGVAVSKDLLTAEKEALAFQKTPSSSDLCGENLAQELLSQIEQVKNGSQNKITLESLENIHRAAPLPRP